MTHCKKLHCDKKWMTLPCNHLKKLISNCGGWMVHFTFKCEFNGKSRSLNPKSVDEVFQGCDFKKMCLIKLINAWQL
jgi:hypothetical protein